MTTVELLSRVTEAYGGNRAIAYRLVGTPYGSVIFDTRSIVTLDRNRRLRTSSCCCQHASVACGCLPGILSLNIAPSGYMRILTYDIPSS